MIATTIRPFEPADRQTLFRIAADTAFFGEPIERYLDDRRVFTDLFYRYYTDFEPDLCWVAETGGVVVGFLAGCARSSKQDETIRRFLLPEVLKGLIRRRYRIGRKTLRYATALALAALLGEIPPANQTEYPAHLHINLDAAYRGLGLGRRLMAAYLSQLEQMAVPGVHLHTTNINQAACVLYKRMGFTLIAQRPTRIWKHLVDKPVVNRLYGKRLIAVPVQETLLKQP